MKMKSGNERKKIIRELLNRTDQEFTYNRLLQFYRAAQACCNEINMDFELDLPNGYGVKLAEMFMETQTVLGKSLEDVSLLNRKDVMQYLKSESLCSCQAE